MRERIMGDGNYYFRYISFILSGTEEFHPEVRKAICDFIEVFDVDLSPFLMKGQGKKYIQDSGMRKNAVWATETEVLATAKIMQCDVFMFHIMNGRGSHTKVKHHLMHSTLITGLEFTMMSLYSHKHVEICTVLFSVLITSLLAVLVSDLITVLHLFIVPCLMFNCYFPFYLLI